MTHSIRSYLTFGIAILGAAGIVAVSEPSALAEGGAGGSGGATVTGPGGSVLGSAGGAVTGVENIPGGLPGLPGCLSGGCTGSLTTVGSIVTGPTAPRFGSPGVQITPTVNLPQPSAIACITAQCHGSGSLSISGGVVTPIVGATGGLNGYIHG
jgi:hypothetical protein